MTESLAGASPQARVLAGVPVDCAPTAVGVVDLERAGTVRYPLRPLAARHARVRLLVRAAGRPLAFVEVDTPGGVLPANALAAAVDAVRGDAAGADAGHGLLAGGTEPGSGSGPGSVPGSVSVVVCTRDRDEQLRRCLRSVLDQAGSGVEVVVVDNAPATDAARRVVGELADRRVRYVLEPRPGLSVARNRGVRQARGDLVAFTDDDVVADDLWLAQLTAAAGRPGVGCVTGLVPSAELESVWQHYFERRIAWGAQLAPQLFGRDDERGPLYPFSAGIFGTGANFAVTRAALDRVGPFDEALGAGRRTRGGEDLDYFVRLIRAGVAISYQPAAVIWHVHRPDEASFRAQLSGYGVGFGAYAAKLLLDPRTAVALARRVPGGIRRLRSQTHRAQVEGGLPADYVRLEMRGMMAGPWAYLRERLGGTARVRRRGKQAG